MRLSAMVFALVLSSIPHSQAQEWTPRLDFKLEDATYRETLTWISGYSYALTEVGRTGRGVVCLGEHQYVDSRVLVDALNKQFKGQRITPEQAAPALFAEVQSRYRCAK